MDIDYPLEQITEDFGYPIKIEKANFFAKTYEEPKTEDKKCKINWLFLDTKVLLLLMLYPFRPPAAYYHLTRQPLDPMSGSVPSASLSFYPGASDPDARPARKKP